MFTGLVEDVGEIVGLKDHAGLREITVRSALPATELRAGDSVSVQGVCLTLIADGQPDGTFRVQAVTETVRRSTLAKVRSGDPVHLERALKLGDRLGGHLVQGHVDGRGRVRRVERVGSESILDIGIPAHLRRYVVEKGSICVDGVSLTVARTGRDWFQIYIVPATAKATCLARYRPGQEVNLEVDLVAKYVESLLRVPRPTSTVD